MSRTDDGDDLSFYLSELYKNLNIISSQLEGALNEQKDIDPTEIDEDVINAMESQFSEWMGSFYNILVYLFCMSIAFLAAMIEVRVRLIPLIMMALFPIYLWFTFLYSIPEIRLNGRIIFSRQDLTLRKQVELGRALFTFFLRQLYDNSKRGIVIMFVFLVFLAITVINQYFITLY